jgi:hypothetical protein
VFRLGSNHIGFMESGVSIVAASRDTQGRPVLGHAMGCRVAPDGGRVTIFLSRLKYPFLLDALRRSGTIAVSFTEPSSNKSIQVKGEAAKLEAGEAGDADCVAAHFRLFTADLDRIHVRAELAQAALGPVAGDLAAIAFTPTVAFIQTPGAQAGTAISA